MEAVSDAGFRALCHAQGASLTWTEMVRASAVARNNASTLDMIDTHDGATPTGVQLLAKSRDELCGALDRLETLAVTSRPHYRNIIAVDINLGCPSPDVIRNGSGPALLKRRARLQELFATLVEFKRDTGLDVQAVGVKIRLGLNKLEAEARVYLPLIDAAASAGIDYVTVHARHAGQRSRDPPSWQAIAEAKAAAPPGLAIIGNGNVFSAADAAAMRSQTGCDGVMLARAAIRNPWVFRDFVQGAAHAGDGASSSAAAAASWDGGRYWPTDAEVDDAAAQYSATAAALCSKPKFVAFHERNFARLKRVASSGDRSIAVESPATIHLS